MSLGPGAPGQRPLIVAHRGAWGSAPQNSLQAFEDAISLGCDAIEFDVRRTIDGPLVVVHDARVRGRPVSRLTPDELRTRMKPGQAPALEAVLELAAGRITMDIELKENGYVDQVMAVIAARLTPDQYVITSFRDPVLPAVKRCVPEVRTGLLVGRQRRAREMEARVSRAGVDFLAIQASLAASGLTGWATDRGLDSWVWTVNGPRALAAALGDARVGAVITDRPQRALSIARGDDVRSGARGALRSGARGALRSSGPGDP